MPNKEGLHFGNWQIGETEFILNGILHADYDSNTFELNLYSDEPYALPYFTKVIYGKTYDGKAFTLFDCSIDGGRSTSIVHDYKTKYSYKVNCNYFIEGATFTLEEDILVKEVYFSVTNLNKWAFQEAVEMNLDNSSNYTITTKKVDDVIHTNKEFVFSINYDTAPDYKYGFSSALTISTNVVLTLKFEKPTTLHRAHILIYQIRDFFSLCTTLPTYIEYILALPHYNSPSKDEFPIRIYGQAIEFKNNDNVRELKNHDIYISLEQVKKDFNICMNNWFQKNEKLKPVIELYLSSKYHRTSYERHFLNLVLALEAYHRLMRPDPELPLIDTMKISEVLKVIPEIHREWVESKISNPRKKIILYDRLKDLFNPKGSTIYEAQYYHMFTLTGFEKEQLIIDIRNTRNYNTHFNEKQKTKSATDEYLYQLFLLMQVIIEYYLLVELEINEKLIVENTWSKMQKIWQRSSLLKSTIDNNISF